MRSEKPPDHPYQCLRFCYHRRSGLPRHPLKQAPPKVPQKVSVSRRPLATSAVGSDADTTARAPTRFQSHPLLVSAILLSRSRLQEGRSHRRCSPMAAWSWMRAQCMCWFRGGSCSNRLVTTTRTFAPTRCLQGNTCHGVSFCLARLRPPKDKTRHSGGLAPTMAVNVRAIRPARSIR